MRPLSLIFYLLENVIVIGTIYKRAGSTIYKRGLVKGNGNLKKICAIVLCKKSQCYCFS